MTDAIFAVARAIDRIAVHFDGKAPDYLAQSYAADDAPMYGVTGNGESSDEN